MPRPSPSSTTAAAIRSPASGGKLGVYQPRHARPKAMSAGKGAKKPAKRAAKTPTKTKPAKKAKRR